MSFTAILLILIGSHAVVFTGGLLVGRRHPKIADTAAQVGDALKSAVDKAKK